ncbi:hypothetical protein E0Z10_g4183 [Xylaria hypoxylon]|uniref:Uncharacterized protein n=1 Tax=Xylaria hypoxylon TaxID=37992 RepID=A0A4Z0YX94_9PEZI|nr:hypothetical protein E0Z10_g4183 [Xylaria hypoxylon]
MLRQLGVGCRNPAHSLTSRLFRSPQLPSSLSWQQRLFSQSKIPRHGPRTNHYRQNGNGTRQLQARIYGSIYTSIGFLVLNEALDWDVRRAMGVETVENIALEKDANEMWRKFEETGQSLLAAYTGADVEYHEDAIRVPSDVDSVEAKVFTAPDPDVEGGIMLLCLAELKDPEGDTYFASNGNRLTDVTDSLAPKVEAFASSLEASPKVRGVMLLLQQDGDWKSLYWDGKRWLNVVYLEWQTAESMGLPPLGNE